MKNWEGVKNWAFFCQKWTFLSKFDIFVEIGRFCQNFTFSSEMDMFVKTSGMAHWTHWTHWTHHWTHWTPV